MKVVDYNMKEPGGPIWPSIRILWIYRHTRYISQIKPRKHTVESITEFLDNVLSGKEEQFLPTEPLPDYNGHLVKKLVGKNFKKLILNETMEKDVLVYYFNPTCPHCKKYHP
jgi:protein-disulfide isomerase